MPVKQARVVYREFAEIWNQADSLQDVVSRTGQSTRAASSLASRMRKLGWDLKMMPGKTTPIENRFFRLVKKTKGCWIWLGSKNKKGYGQIQAGKRGLKPLVAHRVSWIIHFGEIPQGHVVMHTCDNPKCVNPKHLKIGTSRQNSQDMRDKERHTGGRMQPHHLWAVEEALARHIHSLAD